MAEISKTDIRKINRLLRQCSGYIERNSPPTSPAQDLARRCRQMANKLNKKLPDDLSD